MRRRRLAFFQYYISILFSAGGADMLFSCAAEIQKRGAAFVLIELLKKLFAAMVPLLHLKDIRDSLVVYAPQ